MQPDPNETTPSSPPANDNTTATAYGKFRRRIRALILIGIIAAILIAPAFVVAPVPPDWSPRWLTLYGYDMRLLIGVPLRAAQSFVSGSFTDERVRWKSAGERVTFDSDGYEIVGTLYQPEADGTYPGILLLHGSTPEGRTMGMYRMMGEELAKRDYVVLVIDQRGYGMSNDPRGRDPEDFDYVADASSAVDYLQALDNVNAEQIHIIGHSFGGDVAISTGIADDDIQRIVAIGPARRVLERDDDEVDFFTRRDMRYMLLGSSISPELFDAYRLPLVIDSHLDYFADPDHKPILLMDGELEAAADREFLAAVYEDVAGEKAYITLENADHYANIASFGPLMFYDRRVLDEMIAAIDDFLHRAGEVSDVTGT